MDIGGHISLTTTYDYIEAQGLRKSIVFQTFLTNSHGHFGDVSIKRWKDSGIKFTSSTPRVAHASYVTFPWSREESTLEKSIKDIEIMSQCANIIGIKYIVVHMNRNLYKVPNFEKVFERCLSATAKPCILLLENPGSPPNKDIRPSGLPLDWLLVSKKKLSQVAKRIGRKHDWGFCIDTCHLFVSGQPLTSSDEMKSAITTLNRLPVKLIHLNGSRYPIGSGRDAHAPTEALNDFIWRKDNSGLVELLQWCKGKTLPIILERPGLWRPDHYYPEIKRLRELVDLD